MGNIIHRMLRTWWDGGDIGSGIGIDREEWIAYLAAGVDDK